MASLKQNAWYIGFRPQLNITISFRYPVSSDSMTMSDTIVFDVCHGESDTMEFVGNELVISYWQIRDNMRFGGFYENLDARVKGPTKTLYITDERYLKHGNS